MTFSSTEEAPEESLPDRPQPPTGRQSPIPGVTWDWRDLVLGAILAIGTFVILGAAIVITAQSVWGTDAVETMVAEAATVLLLDAVLVGAVVFVIRRKGASWASLGFRRPRPAILARSNGPWVGLTGLIIVGYFAAIAAVNFYTLAAEQTGIDILLPDPQLSDDSFDHDLVVITLGLGVVLGAPLAEEIFFRGFFFAGMRRYLNLPLAGLLSGVVFAAAHGQVGLVIPFALVGLVLAFAYERSGTLLAPIGIHFVFNAVSFIVLIKIPDLR